jgi:RNA polymerase sigma-70 factor (family 1)
MRKKEIHNEEKMMNGFRLGEEKSFSEVFHALFSTLNYYAFKITKDPMISEDIVEDAFVKIWDRRGTFYQFGALKSYLYTIVRNSSIKWIQKNKDARISSTDESIQIPTTDKNRMEVIIEAEVFREMHEFLNRLPKQSQKIIKMIFLEGKKTGEVADEMGLSLSTVKNQKANGLNKLKKYYYT